GNDVVAEGSRKNDEEKEGLKSANDDVKGEEKKTEEDDGETDKKSCKLMVHGGTSKTRTTKKRNQTKGKEVQKWSNESAAIFCIYCKNNHELLQLPILLRWIKIVLLICKVLQGGMRVYICERNTSPPGNCKLQLILDFQYVLRETYSLLMS
ncbi:hypothetical protein Gotri_017416, partial [Gossypium trilobum]|nr:hypothetical protein [Gossypium trilobum]